MYSIIRFSGYFLTCVTCFNNSSKLNQSPQAGPPRTGSNLLYHHQQWRHKVRVLLLGGSYVGMGVFSLHASRSFSFGHGRRPLFLFGVLKFFCLNTAACRASIPAAEHLCLLYKECRSSMPAADMWYLLQRISARMSIIYDCCRYVIPAAEDLCLL